jgi:hypothetical protein
MRSRIITPGTALLGGVILAAGLATGSAAASQAAATNTSSVAPGACTAWQIVTAPQPPGSTLPWPQLDATFVSTDLTGVSVLSDNNVWIGGANDFGGPTVDDDTIGSSWFVHWNGHTAASAVQPSLVLGAEPLFSGVAEDPPGNYPPSSSFDSDDDGWQLLGVIQENALTGVFDSSLPQAEHWQDGRWTLTPMAEAPDITTDSPSLTAVAALSPDDAWAVGSLDSTAAIFGATADGAVIEHWDGTSWSIVPNPAQSTPGAVLSAISVVSPSDIWAAGQQGNPDQTTISGDTPLIEHWDGSSWTVIPAPAAGAPSMLNGISADSATDAWAVGYQTPAGATTMTPLAEHWDGSSWTAVSLPSALNAANGLVSVYAASPGDVWATAGGPASTSGSARPGRTNPENGGPRAPVFAHWDGTSWSTVAVPGPSEYGLAYQYEAIAGHGADVWAVGAAWEAYSTGYLPLIAHLNCGDGTGNA